MPLINKRKLLPTIGSRSSAVSLFVDCHGAAIIARLNRPGYRLQNESVCRDIA
jgi:hypothetical protein